VEKWLSARQATDDNIIRRMRVARWLANATETHSEYDMLIPFPWQQRIRVHDLTLRLYVRYLSFFFCLDAVAHQFQLSLFEKS
jgi:hypothetical protein